MVFKLGLDIHGVIDSLPDKFKILTSVLVDSGNEVHIITGGSWSDDLEKELKEMGIRWTHKFSIYEHLIKMDTPTCGSVTFPDGTVQLKFVDGYWDKVKGEYCENHGIDLHIDDTLIYNDHFKTPFARFWSKNGKPKQAHKSNRHLD